MHAGRVRSTWLKGRVPDRRSEKKLRVLFAKPSRAFALNRFRHGARGSGRRMIGAIHRALFLELPSQTQPKSLGRCALQDCRTTRVGDTLPLGSCEMGA